MTRPDPRLHAYHYKHSSDGQHHWHCPLCGVHITDHDCPHNRRYVFTGQITPISDLRYATSSADPEHAKDIA